MNELITACLDKEDIGALSDFPKELLSANERSTLDFVFKFCAQHKAVPSPSYLSRHVATFVELRSDRPLPIMAIYSETIQRKLLTSVLVKLNEAEMIANEEHRIPTEKISEVLRLSTLASGAHLFSSFDRAKYFRTGDSFPFGFSVIDNATKGMYAGDFGLIIGRLGTKKTTLAQWIAKAWWELGKRVLFISTEMLASDVFSRVDGMTMQFNPLSLRGAEKTTKVESILSAAKSMAKAGKGEIIVPSKRVLTVSEIAAHASSTLADAIVVDGLYLLDAGGHGGQKWERVAAVSNAIKQLAMDLERPILGTTQIKRVGDKFEYDPEDIAYSDALGQDADFIIAIKPERLASDRAELQLIKNRFGPSVATSISVDFEHMQVHDSAAEAAAMPSSEPKEDGKLW